MPILFDYNINFLSESANQTKLPFSVFGMTQQGLYHGAQSIGNQDSASVYVGKNVIIGTVADGCTSGNNLNGKSYNQVGANLMSYLSVRVARKLILKNHIPLEGFIKPFEQLLITHFKKMMNALRPWKQENSEIITNLFASTFISFIITETKYLVFFCGDGDAFINGEKKSMENHSGKYFTNNLYDLNFADKGYLIKEEYQIHCLEIGNTRELNSVLISTDGFIDDDVMESPSFNQFFFSQKGTMVKRGFLDRRTDFRTTLLEEINSIKNGRIWPSDDATFISLHRTINN
jgi:hypothetical protein